MTTDNLTLFQAMADKMRWNEHRQKVIAENIANADTPRYAPNDVTAMDFRDLLKSTTSRTSLTMSTPGLDRTDSKHLSLGGVQSAGDVKEKKMRRTYEVAPAGNAVVIEEQLMKASEAMTDHRLMTNLYQKNVDLIRTALRDGN